MRESSERKSACILAKSGSEAEEGELEIPSRIARDDWQSSDAALSLNSQSAD